jgi:hypothetical protein
MIDEELLLQHRDVAGDVVHLCERCGRPITSPVAPLPEPAGPFATEVEGLRLCADCWYLIETGAVTLEDEEAPEEP